MVYICRILKFLYFPIKLIREVKRLSQTYPVLLYAVRRRTLTETGKDRVVLYRICKYGSKKYNTTSEGRQTAEYFPPILQKLLRTGGIIMAKAGMRRPSPYDADNHGTENHHKMKHPKNEQAQVPEIQGAAKNGNAKAGPVNAPNWARDDYKTGEH